MPGKSKVKIRRYGRNGATSPKRTKIKNIMSEKMFNKAKGKKDN